MAQGSCAIRPLQITSRASMPRLLSSLALASLLVGRPRAASAEESSAWQATLHYNQGHDAMMHGDRERAYAELTQAWRLQQTSETAGLLGQVERKLCLERSPTAYCELYVDAASHLSFARRELPESHPADAPAKLERWLAEVKLQVGTLQLEAPTGAEVLVDGKTVGVAPIKGDVFVAPGTHTVAARANGAQVASEHVDIAKGGVQTVRLLPQKADTPSPAAIGGSGSAGADAASTDSRSAHHPTLMPAYILGGVAVVSLGAGFLFLASANSAEQSARDLASDISAGGCAGTPAAANCAAISDKADSHDAKMNASRVAFIGAGVSAAAALGYVAYALWPRQAKREETTHVAISLSPTSTAVQISGSF